MKSAFGIYIDSDLLLRTHVQRTVSRCFALLCQLQQIRPWVPTDTFQTLVFSLVLTRPDYGYSVLVGLPVYLVCRLQSVLNAAARLTYHLRRSDHITDALVCLHWLCVRAAASSVLHGLAPQYLGLLNYVTDLRWPPTSPFCWH